METLKTAQELIKANSNVMCGFNRFIHGMGMPNSSSYGDKSQCHAEQQGYEFAEKMAKDDGIAFTNVFKCKNGNCHPFQYGGFFVCNDCGGKEVDKDWWKIKVEKDGNEYCCHGLDFVNLQESENYAFGITFKQAIDNYESVMLGIQKKRFEAQIIAECELEGDVISISKILSVKVAGLKDYECELPQTLIATPLPGLILIEKIQGEGAE